MDIISILEEFIGSFFGAFLAFWGGILLNMQVEKNKQKHELKRFFVLLDRNQQSIESIGRLLNQGIEQRNLLNQIITLRDSSDPKHKLYDIKTQAINLTLEICQHCKKNRLYEKILQQIDCQDKIIQLLYGLYDLSDDDLQTKIVVSNIVINNAIRNMESSKTFWSNIKDDLKKMKLFDKI